MSAGAKCIASTAAATGAEGTKEADAGDGDNCNNESGCSCWCYSRVFLHRRPQRRPYLLQRPLFHSAPLSASIFSSPKPVPLSLCPLLRRPLLVRSLWLSSGSNRNSRKTRARSIRIAVEGSMLSAIYSNNQKDWSMSSKRTPNHTRTHL